MPPAPQPRLVLLLGDPVAHSLSPRIHAAAFRAAGVDARYLASRVPAGSLRAAIGGLRAPRVLGANITIPHKEAALAHVDKRSDTAAAVRAINTIVHDEAGGLVGHNTDVRGFLAPLRLRDLDSRAAVIFGAGGAARAATFALLTASKLTTVTLAARRPAQAEAIAHDLASFDPRGALRVTPLADAGAAVRAAHLLVNATSAGMHPNEDATPWQNVADFRAGQIAYDLVYAPRSTRFLADTTEAGAVGIGGIEMLLAQAAEAFELWTGKAFPHRVARESIEA